MKIFNKYFNLLFVALFMSLSVGTHINAAIDENQANKLGNFLDNAFTHMSEEEKEMFMQEVQREQEKLMSMTPEERAAKEEEVSQQLDSLMSEDSPYHDMFEQPMMPQEQLPVAEKIKKEEVQPVVIEKPFKRQPKKNNISADVKSKNKQLVQKIVKAIDSILIKTNNMKEIQHKSWSKDRWSKLKANLQTLKSQLQMAVNSDKVLAELVKDERKGLRDDLAKFEIIITTQAGQLKTPDSMGLVVVHASSPNQLKVIDQKRYDTAVLKLKKIIEKLNNELASHDVVARITGLISKYAPKNKTVISMPGKPVTRKAIKVSEQSSICKTSDDKVQAIKEIKKATKEVKRCSNKQLLNLSKEYKQTKSISSKRKLQWKLSELELHMGKAAKAIKTVPNCAIDVATAVGTPTDYKTLKDTITLLNEINSAKDIQSLTGVDEINSHLILMNI